MAVVEPTRCGNRLLSALVLAAAALTAQAQALKVMPLGDSLTAGWACHPTLRDQMGSCQDHWTEGYRRRLAQLLADAGANAAFVGTRRQYAVTADPANAGEVEVLVLRRQAAPPANPPRLLIRFNPGGASYDVLEQPSGSVLHDDVPYATGHVATYAGIQIRISGTAAGSERFELGAGQWHEGEPGATIEEIADFKTVNNVSPWAELRPQVVLLMAGRNNSLTDETQRKTASDALKSLVVKIGCELGSCPSTDPATHVYGAWVLVAAVPPTRGATSGPTISAGNARIKAFNDLVRGWASTINAKVRFVDIYSTLDGSDIGSDLSHLTGQAAYDKMAYNPPKCFGCSWFEAIANTALTTRYWVGFDGPWNEPAFWSGIDNGPGGATVPLIGATVDIADADAFSRTVVLDNRTPAVQLSRLAVDNRGNGHNRLEVTQDLTVVAAAVAQAGRGDFQVAGGRTRLTSLSCGIERDGRGLVQFSWPAALQAQTTFIGFSGHCSFGHSGGIHEVARQLILGYTLGAVGSYEIYGGELRANQLLVGVAGTGSFDQQGGLVELTPSGQLTGPFNGVLQIAAAPDCVPQQGACQRGSGSYRMQGGELRAASIDNHGLFDFRGGHVAAPFVNAGTMLVAGIQQLGGAFEQLSGGRLKLGFNGTSADQLFVAGIAKLGGTVEISRGSIQPPLGTTLDLLTASRIDNFSPGLMRLPPLTGPVMLRASVVGGTTLRLTVVSLDLDGNNTVDCADLQIVRQSLGKRSGQAGFDPRADVNGDGVVDVRDLAAVSVKLAGRTCP